MGLPCGTVPQTMFDHRHHEGGYLRPDHFAEQAVDIGIRNAGGRLADGIECCRARILPMAN